MAYTTAIRTARHGMRTRPIAVGLRFHRGMATSQASGEQTSKVVGRQLSSVPFGLYASSRIASAHPGVVLGGLTKVGPSRPFPLSPETPYRPSNSPLNRIAVPPCSRFVFCVMVSRVTVLFSAAPASVKAFGRAARRSAICRRFGLLARPTANTPKRSRMGPTSRSLNLICTSNAAAWRAVKHGAFAFNRPAAIAMSMPLTNVPSCIVNFRFVSCRLIYASAPKASKATPTAAQPTASTATPTTMRRVLRG